MKTFRVQKGWCDIDPKCENHVRGLYTVCVRKGSLQIRAEFFERVMGQILHVGETGTFRLVRVNPRRANS